MAQELPQEPQDDGLTLGLRLLLARKKAHLKLVQLERITSIPNSALSRYENDQAVPTIDRLIRIARALGTSPDALLGFGDMGRYPLAA